MEQFDIKVHELEFKYKADHVKLAKFQEFAEEAKPKKILYVGSYDTYYSPVDKASPFISKGLEFVRYRQGTSPELTIKIKLNENNNNSRIEIDLPLSKKVTKYIVEKFLSWFGFKENFEVFKECYIYFYDKIDIVYYIVRDKEEGKQLACFIEIEARKDAKFDSADEAWQLVKEMEQKMNIFNISAANRMKRSMWEIFKKDLWN